LKIVLLADTHAHHRNLRLPKGEVLIHAGDISYRGEKLEIEDFLNWFHQQAFAHKIFIAGNHDFFFEKASQKELSQIIPDDIIYLNDSGVVIGGIHIWGSPITPKFYNWAFNRTRGEAIRKHWEMIPDNTDLLITHGPPYGILDQLADETHIGCKDLLNRVYQLQLKAHVFGHVHESFGCLNRWGIQFINACMTNENYELIHKPVVFNLL
jgi:Icc-related predicted phosphoesterase